MLVVIISIGIVSVYGWFKVDIQKHIILLWMSILGLILLSIVVAGNGVVGRWQGLLIDDRNRYALSRLQLILWTILILSAFMTAVITNLRLAHASTPTNTTMIMNAATIGIPGEIWAIMGITVTSLIGSPLILSLKKGKDNDTDITNKRTNEALAAEGVTTKKADGQLVVNKSPKDADWDDMFKGDYVNNAAQLDLGKIQMMYFTMIIIFVYSIAIAAIFITNANGGIHEFPRLDEGMVGLLGISNGGYLLNKSISSNSDR
jgi:hypothetical protein